MCSKVGVELNFTIQTTNESRDTRDTWGVVPGGAGGAMAHPDFDRSVDPISTRGDRLCPPNYYWHPRIFRPSDGPELFVNEVMSYIRRDQEKEWIGLVKTNGIYFSFFMVLVF